MSSLTHFAWQTPDGKYAYYITILGKNLPAVTGFTTMGEADSHAHARCVELTRKDLLQMGDVELQSQLMASLKE